MLAAALDPSCSPAPQPQASDPMTSLWTPGRALSLLDLSILEYQVRMGGLLCPLPWLARGINCNALC